MCGAGVSDEAPGARMRKRRRAVKRGFFHEGKILSVPASTYGTLGLEKT